jgi:hypothetical protein
MITTIHTQQKTPSEPITSFSGRFRIKSGMTGGTAGMTGVAFGMVGANVRDCECATYNTLML